MPLFMDFHKFEGITVEDVKNAHIADLSVQDKYGVKYHQFWVNQQAGTVFCLMEGPDKESCEAVHREAHGNAACAMVEVESGFYELVMGRGHRVDHGHVRHADGTEDLGFRNVMAITLQGVTSLTHPRDYKYLLQAPYEAGKLIARKIAAFNGRRIEHSGHDSLISVFDSSLNALSCAREIGNVLMANRISHDTASGVIFRIGIGAGQPVTENNTFFEEVIRLADRLSRLAPENHIMISSLASKLSFGDQIGDGLRNENVSALFANDEIFINRLFAVVDNRLGDEGFTIENLGRELGVSRPQLYRKIVTLTGKSPNDLVRGLRMTRALNLLKKRSMNITQVALEVGYNSPSYFTKCFAEKFGCTPSEYVDATGA